MLVGDRRMSFPKLEVLFPISTKIASPILHRVEVGHQNMVSKPFVIAVFSSIHSLCAVWCADCGGSIMVMKAKTRELKDMKEGLQVIKQVV